MRSIASDRRRCFAGCASWKPSRSAPLKEQRALEPFQPGLFDDLPES
jgi:hypothetical protein